VFLGVCGGVLLAQEGVREPSGKAPATPEVRAGIPVAPRTEDGRGLVVPEAHRKLGAVLGTVERERSLARFVSESGIEKFNGETKEIAGYVVVSDLSAALKGEAAPKFAAGAFRVACESIKTGIALRDEHMLGDEWLDAERHPDITFAVSGFSKATRSLDGGMGEVWIGTLAGELSIRGQSRGIEIPGTRVTVTPGRDGTKKGETPTPMTVTIACNFEVALREFGMSGSVLGVSVAERMKVEETIVLMP